MHSTENCKRACALERAHLFFSIVAFNRKLQAHASRPCTRISALLRCIQQKIARLPALVHSDLAALNVAFNRKLQAPCNRDVPHPTTEQCVAFNRKLQVESLDGRPWFYHFVVWLHSTENCKKHQRRIHRSTVPQRLHSTENCKSVF